MEGYFRSLPFLWISLCMLQNAGEVGDWSQHLYSCRHCHRRRNQLLQQVRSALLQTQIQFIIVWDVTRCCFFRISCLLLQSACPRIGRCYFYYAAVVYSRITRLVRLSVCLSVRLYGLVTRKQGNVKNRNWHRCSHGMSQWTAIFRSKGHRTWTSKIWRNFTYGGSSAGRLHTRPTPLLGLLYCRRMKPLATGRTIAYNVGAYICC